MYTKLRRKKIRSLKKDGKIKPEQFKKEELEQLGVLLIKFCAQIKKGSEGRLLTFFEHIAILDAESLFAFIDLVLSDETEYGYLQAYYEKIALI